ILWAVRNSEPDKDAATYPFDLTKTRLQIQSEVAAAKHGFKLENHGMIKTAVGIAKHEGVLKLWSGLMPMFQRHAIYSGSRLIIYEQFRGYCKDENGKFLIRECGMADTALVHSAAAFTAGFVAAVVGTPADVLKTRLMNQPVGPDGRGTLYRGMIDCLQQSVRNEGLLSLYKGFLPLWMRLGPWALINWIAFENIMLAIGGHTF
ncbi:unnamed protein product, partial [Leptidea sinapis]